MKESRLPDFSDISFCVGDEIILRRFVEQDIDTIYAVVDRNKDHLMEFMHWMVPDYSREMAQEFFERSTKAADTKESLGFGIFRDTDLLGSIGFVHFDELAGKTEIGYWIDQGEEGKGIVSAACKTLIDFAFDELGMNRIEIRCSAENTRSAAIPKRFGFKHEGHLREAEFRNGKLHDFLVFGLLKAEWERSNHA